MPSGRTRRAHAEILAQAAGDHAGALRALREARQRVTDPEAVDELAAAEVVVHAHAGDAPACLSVADPVLARPGLSDRVRLSTLAASVSIRAMAGDFPRALADADQGLALLGRRSTPAPLARVMVGTGRGLALLGLGRLREAEAHCRAGYDAAVDGGIPELAGAWAVCLGAALLERPRPAQARILLAEAVATLAEADPLDLRLAALALAATAAGMLGDVRAARRWVDELDRSPALGAARFAGWARGPGRGRPPPTTTCRRHARR